MKVSGSDFFKRNRFQTGDTNQNRRHLLGDACLVKQPEVPELLELDFGASCFQLAFELFCFGFVEQPSLTALPPASTSSLASLRPRPVMARTSLITLIFDCRQRTPGSRRIRSFSSSAAAPPASPASCTGNHNRAASGRLDAVFVFEDGFQFLCFQQRQVDDFFCQFFSDQP